MSIAIDFAGAADLPALADLLGRTGQSSWPADLDTAAAHPPALRNCTADTTTA